MKYIHFTPEDNVIRDYTTMQDNTWLYSGELKFKRKFKQLLCTASHYLMMLLNLKKGKNNTKNTTGL